MSSHFIQSDTDYVDRLIQKANALKNRSQTLHQRSHVIVAYCDCIRTMAEQTCQKAVSVQQELARFGR